MPEPNKQFANKKNPGSYWEIWLIAYPLILMNASHTIMQFVDRKFMSCYLLGISLIILFRFRSGKWKKINMLDEHKGEDQVISEAEANWK